MSDQQLELPLEWPDPPESYRVELLRGPLLAETEVLRSHEVHTEEDAFNMMEALRLNYAQREGVAWRSEDADATGHIYGLKDGISYVIQVTPPLPVA